MCHSIPFKNKVLEEYLVLVVSVCRWELSYLFLSAVGRLKMMCTEGSPRYTASYNNTKATVLHFSFFYPLLCLLSFLSIEQMIMKPDTVLGTEEPVGNKSVRSLQSPNTHPRGHVGDK